MCRSPSFASDPCDFIRPFKTRFRYAYAGVPLKLATETNSPAHYAKGTPSPLRAPTACKHAVSGLFTPLVGDLFTFQSLY